MCNGWSFGVEEHPDNQNAEEKKRTVFFCK